MANPIEIWKAEKHGFDVWPDVVRHAAAGTPMKSIDAADLERMKWHGFFYRKRDQEGRYMTRIRVTAGELNATQAKEIAYIAYQLGHGIVDVTTRANIQVQGLKIEHLPEVAARLERCGLTAKQTGHDNVRNVFAHPFSGLQHDELYDTRRLCHDVTALFLDSREYSDLPRKLNVCLNGSAQHSAHFWTQDLSFLATHDELGDVAFQVLVAGTQGQNPQLARHLPVLVAPEQVVDVTRALFDLFRERGTREKRNAARLRFLVDEIGVEGVLEWLERRLAYRLRPSIRPPEPAVSHDELIGWFPQRQRGLWTMGLSVPLGRLTWQQLEGLAVLAQRWGDGQLRTTHEQGIAVINIPAGFKDAAATDAAALGLGLHVDDLERGTMACTGSQFCNIAVVETKGQMFQLLERLRQRGLKLHGIRIHMSGCPSSCAQHFTADIGLKGVRVRRLLGTREGFDVYLGGGIAGQVHLALPFRTGVDCDQLPTLIEEVVGEYYRRRQVGQTFSGYWRERLRDAAATKTEDHEYQTPVWLCEGCGHRHAGEDPPVFCPRCAALRRHFARLELDAEAPAAAGTPAAQLAAPTRRADGFVRVADQAALEEGRGLTVSVAGRDVALFRSQGRVAAFDSACPHEGAPLADGELRDGVVTCPWHQWTFDACTGCGLHPVGQQLVRHEARVEDEGIWVRLAGANSGSAAETPTAAPTAATTGVGSPNRPSVTRHRPQEAALQVLEVIDEAPDVRTFRLDNRDGQLPLDLPGRFVKVWIPTAECWRPFTISSSPTSPSHVELTIKRNPEGVATPWLFAEARPGTTLRVQGPHGGFCFDPVKHAEPLVLLSAGSGVTPMISIARYLDSIDSDVPCLFLHGVRRPADAMFLDECRGWAERRPSFRHVTTVSQPDASWGGACGRVGLDLVRQFTTDLTSCRYFVCGPGAFCDETRAALMAAGVATPRIHTEQFLDGAIPRPAAAPTTRP